MSEIQKEIERTYLLIDQQIDLLRSSATRADQVQVLQDLHFRAQDAFFRTSNASLQETDPEVGDLASRLRQINSQVASAIASDTDLDNVLDGISGAVSLSEQIASFGPGGGH